MVTIEPWGPDDLPLLRAVLGDPRMTQHLGGPEADDALMARQERYVKLNQTGPGRVFASRLMMRRSGSSATGSSSGRATRSLRSAGP